ncbi:DUF2975 domain-containing protein [Actinocorallia sp. A-T 12471]|uniref:DUF2975 domain-containing protein n=1 Tax=Actinocorallia sp. A-T 12471 TaxID=3089813 RepID=UPI0029CF64A8|nr:DUF2975 domain-containing protein [Actinocorallia sp. A-T 12471]MDX6743999.1 DUF2975 domain-containing protein [Actinocorallia sp. A-T 12471]
MSQSRDPLQPFSLVIRLIFGGLVAVWLVGLVAAVFSENFSFGGVDKAVLCVEPEVRVAGGEYEEALASYWATLREMTVKPGSELLVTGLRMCDFTPSVEQRALSGLASLPSALVYLVIFFLFYRLVRAAATRGPFAPDVAARLRTIGWTLIVGGYLGSAVGDAATLALQNTFTMPGTDFHHGPVFILLGGVLSFSPTEALTGLGLLTIARLMRVGARMHEDLRGTV